MDLFTVFPQLTHEQNVALQARSLRLIALSALVYDDAAFYFEISDARFWGRLAHGKFAIGVGAVKVRPDPHNDPARALSRYLHKTWRCIRRWGTNREWPNPTLDWVWWPTCQDRMKKQNVTTKTAWPSSGRWGTNGEPPGL